MTGSGRAGTRVARPFGALACWMLSAAFLLGAAAVQSEPGPVYSDAESVRPLAVGAQVPSAPVRRIDGTTVDLASLVAEQGALLVFYRGGW